MTYPDGAKLKKIGGKMRIVKAWAVLDVGGRIKYPSKRISSIDFRHNQRKRPQKLYS